MARTPLAAQVVDADGVGPIYTGANVDGHTLNVGDILHVKNGAGAPINVTVQTGRQRFFGSFEADLHGQPSGADQGRVYVDFSAVATITVAALKQA